MRNCSFWIVFCLLSCSAQSGEADRLDAHISSERLRWIGGDRQRGRPHAWGVNDPALLAAFRSALSRCTPISAPAVDAELSYPDKLYCVAPDDSTYVLEVFSRHKPMFLRIRINSTGEYRYFSVAPEQVPTFEQVLKLSPK